MAFSFAECVSDLSGLRKVGKEGRKKLPKTALAKGQKARLPETQSLTNAAKMLALDPSYYLVTRSETAL